MTIPNRGWVISVLALLVSTLPIAGIEKWGHPAASLTAVEPDN